jgi:hypothetical protein
MPQDVTPAHVSVGIGFAYTLYTSENSDFYPARLDWQAGGGKDGFYDIFVAATNRPLNAYLGNWEIFRCPSDKGDELTGATNCYLQYGNSYLVQWFMDSFRTRHLAGDSSSPPGSYEATPMKLGEVGAGPVNKILQGCRREFKRRIVAGTKGESDLPR